MGCIQKVEERKDRPAPSCVSGADRHIADFEMLLKLGARLRLIVGGFLVLRFGIGVLLDIKIVLRAGRVWRAWPKLRAPILLTVCIALRTPVLL